MESAPAYSSGPAVVLPAFVRRRLPDVPQDVEDDDIMAHLNECHELLEMVRSSEYQHLPLRLPLL